MLKKILTVLVMLYAAASFAAVDANKASAAELDGLKGIGPGISSKIIDERKKGSFKDWQDLIDRVKGVGEHNAVKFSAEGLTVNGTTFKGVAATPAAKKQEKAETKADTKVEKAEAKADKKETKAEIKAEKKEARAQAKAEAAKPASAPKPAASAASAARK